jgi:hypothetical protein
VEALPLRLSQQSPAPNIRTDFENSGGFILGSSIRVWEIDIEVGNMLQFRRVIASTFLFCDCNVRGSCLFRQNIIRASGASDVRVVWG